MEKNGPAPGHQVQDSSESNCVIFCVDFTITFLIFLVCQRASKNCRVVYDVWTRCWDSEEGQVARGGVGLMSNWYDACQGKNTV